MTPAHLLSILHFSDVLCIWAYIAQIRIDQLKSEFGSHVELQYHFLPVFGAVESMIKNNWDRKGGYEAYNKHVLNIASKFDHATVNEGVWLSTRPVTSVSCHLFIKALQILETQGELSQPRQPEDKTEVEKFVWALRLAFFRDLKDISNFRVQTDIAEGLNLPVNKIQKKIESGEAYAALFLDLQLKEKYHVTGSPTIIFNRGRQLIYGNVGYRVIEANIRELMNEPESQASWC